jgi:hypothetical protein
MRWTNPQFGRTPRDAFFCIETIHKKRKTMSPLENGIDLASVFPKHFVPAYYLVHERNYLFLWKQLLGLERFYLSAEDTHLLNQIFPTTLRNEELGSVSFQTYLVKVTQIHLLCALLEGNLLLQPTIALSPDTLTLIRVFLNQLPHYDQLLKKHPEMPLLYELVWQDRAFLLNLN